MRRFILLLGIMAFVSCTDGDRGQRIRQAVVCQLTLYPESRLTDLYKSFFQAEFGAEHIVSDTAAAGRYLNEELSIPDSAEILYEPIGADSSYYRVHLVCVQRGLISRDQLFTAFISGVHSVTIPQIESWKDTWGEILTVIDGMDLNLEGYDDDCRKIGEILDSGGYAVHHSEIFSTVYKPHYRIIRRDIFINELQPFIDRL